jgi:hypothetical protein
VVRLERVHSTSLSLSFSGARARALALGRDEPEGQVPRNRWPSVIGPVYSSNEVETRALCGSEEVLVNGRVG